MNRLSLKAWLIDEQTSSSEKALFSAAALTFFCLPLGTAPSTIAASITAVIWIFSGIAVRRRSTYRSPYWWPVFALMLLPWIGMLYTCDDTGLGLDYAVKTHYWLFGLAVAAIPFRHFPVVGLIHAFLLGLGVNVVAAIFQIVFHMKDTNDWHVGLGPDYSTLSAYLIVGIMMGLFFVQKAQGKKMKVVFYGLAGLYFFHLVALKSRAGYIAFVLLIPFIGYTFFQTKKTLKTAIICLIIPSLMMISPVVRKRIEQSAKELKHHITADHQEAWGRTYSDQQDRFYMWYGAIRIIKDHPILGVGTGGYQNSRKAMDSSPNAPLIAHPHNNFLYMATSFGLLGTAIFAWFLMVTLFTGWRKRVTAAGYMIVSVVVVMTITGLFNTQILDMGAAMFLSLTVGLKPALFVEPAE